VSLLGLSYGRLRARLVLFVAVLGLVAGLHAVVPARAHAEAAQCDLSEACDRGDDGAGGGGGTGGGWGEGGGSNAGDPGSGSDGQSDGGPDAGPGASGSGDPSNAGGPAGDPGGVWGDPSDPTGWGGTYPSDVEDGDRGGVVDCDGAVDCTVAGDWVLPGPHDPAGTGEFRTWDDPPDPLLFDDPMPSVSPVDGSGSNVNRVPEDCNKYLDMARAVWETERDSDRYKSLYWHYAQCEADDGWNFVARVDPPADHGPTGPAAATVAPQAAAGKQLHAATAQTRAATQAATKALQQASAVSARHAASHAKATRKKRRAAKRHG
jgi:hypothetical protein